jgi:UDP-GlcNAc:undecaprenyl-phosphate GlcNAc-1-phosphate transferase
MFKYFGILIGSFILTVLCTPFFIRIAHRYDCLDAPGKRRFHSHPTPRWGGLAFFIGFIPVALFINLNKEIVSYLIASFILVTMGAVDDWKHLGWRIKFIGIIAAASIVIFGGGIKLSSVGYYGSFGDVTLGLVAIPFTYFCIIGVTNAINLIDGLNGLAGGVSLLGFLFMGMAAYVSGNYDLALVAAAFVGALFGFLMYNFPKAKIFMGDSGSLFLGLSLAVYAVLLTQNKQYHVNPMLPVIVLIIPIFDTIRVMLVRIFNFKNPFKADKTHFHHLLVRKGFSSKMTVILIWVLTAIFGTICFMIFYRTSTPYLFVFLLSSLILTLFIDSISKPKTRRKINPE